MPQTVLVAGATGAVGSALVPMLRARGFRVIPHVRPKTAPRHPLGNDPDALICDLSDSAALDAAMARADAVVCLVGTMRRRFAAGDTYESSDYQPVVDLVASAKRVPSPRPRRFVLLSALGARASRNAYLDVKHRAEEVVRNSGLPWAILRPSMLDSTHANSHASDGTQRKPPPGMGAAFQLVSLVPGLRKVTDDLRPIPIEILNAAIVTLLRRDAAPDAVLSGRELWPLATPR